MEPLGTKLQQTRVSKNISLDDAARATKIRTSRLAEIEQEDFSNFPSLAYAKGFVQIYGKFLEVDVTPYLDSFEVSKSVTVDGYSYLQEATGSTPRPVPRRQQPARAPVLPLIIFVVALVVGFFLVKLVLDIQRIAPKRASGDAAITSVSPSIAPTVSPGQTGSIVAPRALPVDPPVAGATPLAESPAPVIAERSPSPAATEPEVRRAEPVHPEDLAKIKGAAVATPPAAVENKVQIRSLKKTFVKVIVDNYDLKPAIDRWIFPADGPVTLRGRHLAIRVLDRSAVEITKNGGPLSDDDPDVTLE
jgi:cytoskeletal protein RodZ